MTSKIGCDIVNIRKFENSVQRGGRRFLSRLFSSQERAGTHSTQSLAGMFAAKEAVVKALGLKAGDWKNIEIVKNKNGKPEAKILAPDISIISQDISISHDGDYAFAVAIFLLNV